MIYLLGSLSEGPAAGTSVVTAPAPRSADELAADARSLFQQGMNSYEGKGVIKNLPKAAECFRKAAELGHLQAHVWIGWCYLNGDGLAKDKVVAVDWFRKAAARGMHVDRFKWHTASSRAKE
jgi:TPR repeat protein